MTDKNRAALEAACARAVDSMMRRDEFDVGVSHVNAGDHVVRIMTRESYDLDGEQMRRYRDRAEHAERARQDTERLLSAEADRADAAERMVAELADAVGRAAGRCRWGCTDNGSQCGACEILYAALSSTADVAGRWCPVAERDAAIAARDEAVAKLTACEIAHVVEIGKVAAAERARDEVGIQLAAAQAEIARMQPVVDAARCIVDAWLDLHDGKVAIYRGDRLAIVQALDALDTVPGDALAQSSEQSSEQSALRSRVAELEGLLREAQTEIVASVEHSHCHRVYVDGVGADQLADRITRALEASGIDTANVKGGE
jgi:hypothetical protein